MKGNFGTQGAPTEGAAVQVLDGSHKGMADGTYLSEPQARHNSYWSEVDIITFDDRLTEVLLF